MGSKESCTTDQHLSSDTNGVDGKTARSNGTVDNHPFRYTLYTTRWDRIVFYIMAVTVAPIRLALIFLFFSFTSLAARIAVMGLPLEPDTPLAGWRLVFRDLTVNLALATGYVAGFVTQRVKGKQATSEEAPLLIMAPHTSSIEILAGTMCGLPGAVSMIENARIPVIGAIFRACQSIFVERGDPDSRNKAAQKIRIRADAKGAWPQLIVLPEGFCSNGRCLLPFKTGAFLPGVPVQPVTVKYTHKHDVTSWIDSGPGIAAIWSLMLCTPLLGTEIEFHPVYRPSEEEKKDPELFARNVRDVMSRYLNLPTTEMTYRDLKALVQRTKPDTSMFGLWKSIIMKGYVEMPPKEHLS